MRGVEPKFGVSTKHNVAEIFRPVSLSQSGDGGALSLPVVGAVSNLGGSQIVV